ncbi:MAG: hypothetical protein ABIR91_03905 [Candidatus Saccharimonadales bacterium]
MYGLLLTFDSWMNDTIYQMMQNPYDIRQESTPTFRGQNRGRQSLYQHDIPGGFASGRAKIAAGRRNNRPIRQP